MQVDISAMINKNKLTIFLNVVKYILYGTIIHTDCQRGLFRLQGSGVHRRASRTDQA